MTKCLLYLFFKYRSIGRLAGLSEQQIEESARNHKMQLEHDKEFKLAKLLLRMPEIIQRVLEDLLLHTLCDYLYELAGVFTEFYDNCYVVEKDRTTGTRKHPYSNFNKILNISIELNEIDLGLYHGNCHVLPLTRTLFLII